jgi:hypothetical protein
VLSTIIVSLTPSTIQAGTTAIATAAGFDQSGAPIATGALGWSTGSGTVATIGTSGGLVTGVGTGQTAVIAAAGGVQGQALLTVTAPAANPVLTVVGGGAGTGSGRVTSVPAGIDCTITNGVAPGTCAAGFALNTSVQLQPAAGVIASWADGCTGAAACQVTMSQDRRVVVTFGVALPIIVLKSTKPVVVADRVQQNIPVIDYSIQNGGGGTLTPSVSPANPAPWLQLSIVGGTTLRLSIAATGLLSYSEAATPYIASATVSAPGAPSVPVTIKFARTFDQPAGMAATVVRFHRNSNDPITQPPPANVNAVIDLLDDRSNTRVAAQVVAVDPPGQNWLVLPTTNANGQLVLQPQAYTGFQTPAGNLPGGTNLLGSPIRISMQRAAGATPCPPPGIAPDPTCQVFVYYDSDPFPRLLFRPWGVQLTPANPTQSAAIEVQTGSTGSRLDPPVFVNSTCGAAVPNDPIVTTTQVTITGDLSVIGQDSTKRCKIFIAAVYRDAAGVAQGFDAESLLVTLAKPSADVITPSERDLNLLATAGAAAPAPHVLTLHNLGPRVITLTQPTFGANTCPAGLLVTPSLTGTTLGQGNVSTVSVSMNPAGLQPLTCTANLTLGSSTAGVLSETIPISVRIK